MAVTAADVPAKYDVVFVGVPNVSDFGCVYADSVEPSLPFRTHRAIYDRTPTFIERQNISGSWGDDQQDFFMTQSQNDWSLGAGQKYLNDPADATQLRKFWSCLRAEVTIPGEISLGATSKAISAASFVSANTISNPGFESGTTGWSTGVGNTLTQDATHIHSGTHAGKVVLGGTDTKVALATMSPTPAGGATWSAFAWVYIPSSFTGSAVTLNIEGANSGSAAANLALRDQWQLVALSFVSVNSATTSLVVRATANNGDTVWVDDASISTPLNAGCSAGIIAPGKHYICGGNVLTVDAAGAVVDTASASTATKWGATTDGHSVLTGKGLCFLNNLLYSCDGSVLTQGASTLFTWKDSTGTAYTPGQRTPKLIPYGGKVLIFWQQLTDRPELWQYDGSATAIVAALPKSAIGHDIIEIEGLVYISGTAASTQNGINGARPTVWVWDGSSIAKVWESPYVTSTNALNSASMPCLGTYNSDLVFTDPAQANGPGATPLLMRYVIATGAIYPLDSYALSSVTGVFAPFMSSTGTTVIFAHNDALTNPVLYPYDHSAAGQLDTSLFTFDNSLTKLFRGVTIDWTGDTAPNVAFQVDSVDGSYTALASGVTSGAETAFPAGTTGRGVSIRITIPSGTTKIKRIYVRAAPELNSYRRGVYIIDCTGTTANPRQLRDGTPAPTTGYETAQNLLAAATSKTPFTVTDKINGTYTGLVDLQDPEGWDVYEVHPAPDDKKRPGCYLVRVTVREV